MPYLIANPMIRAIYDFHIAQRGELLVARGSPSVILRRAGAAGLIGQSALGAARTLPGLGQD
jgi:hypothetical protein